MTSKKCQNCNKNFTGNFCSACGQRDIANQRLQWGEVVSDFLDNFFNLDKGFLFTFWQLLKKPGTVGRSFIRGERKKYTNPIRYLIIAVAIQAFMDYWFLQAEPGSNVEFFNIPFLSEETNERMAVINHLMATKYAFIHYCSMIILFPAIFYLIFRKLHYRYIELLTINFYYFATSLLIILIILTGGLSLNIFIPIPVIILTTMGYIFWCNFLFYSDVSRLKRFLFLLISIVLFMLIRVFLLIYLLSIFFPSMAENI
jgi:hypothetical protein